MRSTTVLDDLILTCDQNAGVMPVLKHMQEIIKETCPVAHRWAGGLYLPTALPAEELLLPDPVMCLFMDQALVPDYRFAVDVGVPEFNTMMGSSRWSLCAILVFQRSGTSFELVPLVRTHNNGPVLMDMQLMFNLQDGKWVGGISQAGPINPMFHSWFIQKMTDEQKQKTTDNVVKLCALVSEFLGAYLSYTKQKGSFIVHVAQPSKTKVRNGRTVKVYKPATVGYKQFVTESNI